MVDEHRIKLFRLLLDLVSKKSEVNALSQCPSYLQDLLYLAKLNKVELEVAIRLGVRDEVSKLLDKYGRVVRFACAVSRVLERCGVKFAFFKFLRPVRYVPSDVDLLIHVDHVKTAVKALCALGFRVEVVEPFTVTLRCGEYVVDVYVHPCVAGSVCYLNGEVLLEHVYHVDMCGINVPCLRPYAEAIVVTAHALYKEHIVTLNDYLTFKKWFNDRAEKLSRELKCETAIRYMRSLVDLVEKGCLVLPYRLPLAHAVQLAIDKVCKDSLTRSTLLLSISKLRDRRLLNQVVVHLTRETY